MTSDSSDPSQPSFIRSDPDQVSSIQFAGSIIASLGAPLRDGSHEDDEDSEDNNNMAVDSVEASEVVRNDEEMHAEESSETDMNTGVGNSAGPSRVCAPKNIAGPNRICVMENVAGPSRIPAVVSDHPRQSA